MSNGDLNWIASFIWGIADDVLRDVYVRGKYRDVILPMTVIRRLDAVLEPTKPAVLAMKQHLDAAGIAHQEAALGQAAGQAFYNASPFTLRDLRARAKAQQLRADFEAYLDGFSPNVQEILDKFKLRNHIPTLVEADILGSLIEKFLDHSVNLGPTPVLNSDGAARLPGLDNHAMGTLFEELIRRFNEENNEEAGEHFTPRDVVRLMAELILAPIAGQIESGTYLVYDGACGTGGELLRGITSNQIGLVELAPDLDIDTVTEIFIRVNSEGVPLSQADFAMSKIAVNETYGGNTLRRAVDYFCHLAVTPDFHAVIQKNDPAFAQTDFFAQMSWLRKENDDLYDPSYTDLLRVAFASEFRRGRLEDLVALLSGRNFETRQFEESIVEDSFARLRQAFCAS